MVLRAAHMNCKHTVPAELTLDIAWFNKYAKASNGYVLVQSAPRTGWVIECDALPHTLLWIGLP